MAPPLPTEPIKPEINPELAQYSVTLAQYLSTSAGLTNLAIGALIFTPRRARAPAKILLLQRAAHDSFPDVWEVPGGSVDAADASILDSVVREVWEETGLRAARISQRVWASAAPGEQKTQRWETRKRGPVERWAKLCFLVQVEEGGAVRLDPEEHRDWGWFAREELGGLDLCFEDAKEVIVNAFALLA